MNDNFDSQNYGLLGKKDSKEFDLFDDELPFGFRILKPLMNELNKQMSALDKEMKGEMQDIKKIDNENNIRRTGNPTTSFSIYVSAPGQKPIKINRVITNEGRVVEPNLAKQNLAKQENLILPKVGKNILEKSKRFIKLEPETLVRRLSDKVIYELKVPGIKSPQNIDITKIEEGYEIKAFSNKEVFIKKLVLGLPLVNYSVENENLVLDFGLEN
jgi:hypothetical protein